MLYNVQLLSMRAATHCNGLGITFDFNLQTLYLCMTLGCFFNWMAESTMYSRWHTHTILALIPSAQQPSTEQEIIKYIMSVEMRYMLVRVSVLLPEKLFYVTFLLQLEYESMAGSCWRRIESICWDPGWVAAGRRGCISLKSQQTWWSEGFWCCQTQAIFR